MYSVFLYHIANISCIAFVSLLNTCFTTYWANNKTKIQWYKLFVTHNLVSHNWQLLPSLYISCNASSTAAWAAAIRGIGTRNGEHETSFNLTMLQNFTAPPSQQRPHFGVAFLRFPRGKYSFLISSYFCTKTL